ncbi:hypothetical protein OPT61_g5543 [Boeremia exigua]|uniref:Uncharacterized protein n=1 Tax=Boeremia exigua TaxID=749465 RepID=A0ACC2IA13_9PLEO|nr:hypothetical protein OPT61_g5543 [Boeremia exigua]
MDNIKSEDIKQEEDDLPRFESTGSEIPTGFESCEWVELLNGFHSREHEIDYTLTSRGQVSAAGRKTGAVVPFKGELSSNTRAVQQRNRLALQTKEEAAIKKASDADRSAKYQARAKVQQSEAYLSGTPDERAALIAKAEEETLQRRFDKSASAEWLENKLAVVNRKWDSIQHEIDLRKHQAVMDSQLKDTNKIPTAARTTEGQAGVRIYGAGGTFEKLLRQEYQRGLRHLTANTFSSPDAKREWEAFRDSLSPKSMAIVLADDWEQREPVSLLDTLSEDMKLKDSRPYLEARYDDECEEEIEDSDYELEEYYRTMPNEYESDDEYYKAITEEAEMEDSEMEDSEMEDSEMEDSEMEEAGSKDDDEENDDTCN